MQLAVCIAEKLFSIFFFFAQVFLHKFFLFPVLIFHYTFTHLLLLLFNLLWKSSSED